ncbi:holin-like protein [Azospirillum fermentarium]|uniref:CidA/LrgA family protein n=1 Tax=Azospirillum fermentarium TaxID=1233114 RepID=UPI002227F774|nr:CidA/LrgA family protein [Azospirillum fermentarium]MCW2248550.1 holin-like protein [Azospirillum fermentarium]
MNALQSIGVLLGCQLAGEVAVRLLAVPLPGAVVGCVLLFALLTVRAGVPGGLKTMADGLLRYLPVMFVPAGVGVMADAERVRDEWLALLTVLVLGTVVTAAVTLWSFDVMARAVDRRAGAGDDRR